MHMVKVSEKEMNMKGAAMKKWALRLAFVPVVLLSVGCISQAEVQALQKKEDAAVCRERGFAAEQAGFRECVAQLEHARDRRPMSIKPSRFPSHDLKDHL